MSQGTSSAKQSKNESASICGVILTAVARQPAKVYRLQRHLMDSAQFNTPSTLSRTSLRASNSLRASAGNTYFIPRNTPRMLTAITREVYYRAHGGYQSGRVREGKLVFRLRHCLLYFGRTVFIGIEGQNTGTAVGPFGPSKLRRALSKTRQPIHATTRCDSGTREPRSIVRRHIDVGRKNGDEQRD
jgi:hypothetical protein